VSATAERPVLVRGLGVFDATMLVMGTVIGSGIFVAPSIMAGYVESPALQLGLWLIGGLLTLAGALSVAELAAAMPGSGGQYVFLRAAFGPATGFLFGWTYFIAICTGVIAAVAVAFGKHVGVFLPGVDEATVLAQLGPLRISTAQAVAIAVTIALTALNVQGLRLGAMVQNTFTIAKVAAIAVLVGLTLALGGGSAAAPAAAPALLGAEGARLGLFAALAVAMSKALFAYDAWYTAAMAAEEVRDPERNLPRALLLGTLGVTAVYLSAVGVYLYLVPAVEMAGVPDNRIAAYAAGRLLGGAGEGFVALAILVSTFGCANGLVLSGARVAFAMARDGLFFEAVSRIHPERRTPATALWLQGAIACTLALTGSYSDLLTMTAFTSLLFNMLTVAGLFVLRRRRPDLHRPYRTWGYPLLPAAFIAVSLFFLFFILKGDPRNSGMGLALTALGIPAYAWFRRRSTAAEPATVESKS
jgi:APA family basic amino acid/polyamine antiporter